MDATEQNDWCAYRAAGDVDARNRLVERHIRLVQHFARRMLPRAGARMTLDELVSAGFLGLLDAVEAYDPARGYRFSTFAAPRIRGAMLDELRRSDAVPRSVRRKQRQMADAEQRLADDLDRAPRHGEVSTVLGVTPQTLWRWKADVARGRPLSLEEAVGGSSGRSDAGSRAVREVIGVGGTDEVEERLTREQELRRLEGEMSVLDERERMILRMYDLDEYKLREVAAVLEVSESRVSQIRTRALRRLRDRLGDLREPVAA